MNRKSVIIAIACLSMCSLLIGCGGNNTGKEITNDANNAMVDQPVVENKTEEVRPEIKIANCWMKLPQNVNMFWKTEVKSNSDYDITEQYKRGNDVFLDGESYVDGKHITADNDGISNRYYFYHHVGDYKWKSYVYFENQGWDNWYFGGNYPASPQNYCFGRPWNILDNYSDNHETIEIEGVGTVDTVIGTDDEGYTYYYSKDLGFNVKIENKVQVWYLTKFDTSVSSSFPYALPDMDALAKKEEEEATNKVSETEDNSSFDESSSYVVEDENGELVVYDE